MKKHLTLIIFFLVILSSCSSDKKNNNSNFKESKPKIEQKIDKSGIIKRELDQFFLHIKSNASKYEVRKTLHLNNNLENVSEYKEYCNCFSADILYHPVLKYMGYDSRIILWFNEEVTKTVSRKIIFKYAPSDLNKCEIQLKDLYNSFNSLSYKTDETEILNRGEITGEGLDFYLNETKYNSKQSYLNIHYRYIASNTTFKTKPYYQFEIIFVENNLK